MNLDYQLDGPDGAPVIVLSNSLGTTRAMWQPQIEALTAHFRVLRYDTHGHGKTTKNGKVTLAQLGEDVIALLDHLNIDRAWFCGISMGGLTGLWLGRFAPERFHGLAVANTAARIGDQASWLSRARAVRQEGMAVVAAGAADRWFTHAFRQKAPEVVEALCHQLTHTDAEGYAACCEALAAADLRGEVGQIPLPTLIIAGESDPVTTVGDAHFLQQQIPASEVVVLAASHLSNIEAPKSFTSALLSFFSTTALEGTGYVVAALVLAVFIGLGIVFDMIGVAVTAADPKPFHSMAAHKEKGAKAAIRLLQNANQVSSVCNDVVGDICGIVSGSTAAVIVTHLQRDLSTTSVLISIGATALISGITIGGKALGKTVAINQCTSVVYRVARIMHALHLSR